MSASAATTAYAVTHGSYSDYSIVAIFATRQLAAAAIASMEDKYGDEAIEEYPIYEAIPRRVLLFTKECFAGKVREHEHLYHGWEDPMHKYVGRVTRGLGFGKWSNTSGDHYRYWGTDKARVQKAFDDYHAQRQAELAGIA